MIRRPVTFILGAGVSLDYGYPLGEGLYTHILNRSSLNFISNKEEQFEEIEKITGFGINLITRFHDTLERADNFAIDEFLRIHSKEFGNAGKFYIAWAILEHERDFKPPSETSPYKHIFKKFVTNPNELRRGGNLTFLTFNYDLSLERYMYDHYKYYLNIQSDQEIKNYIRKTNQSIRRIPD